MSGSDESNHLCSMDRTRPALISFPHYCGTKFTNRTDGVDSTVLDNPLLWNSYSLQDDFLQELHIAASDMHSLSREASWTLKPVAISILGGGPSPRFRAVVRVMIPFLDSSFSKEVFSSFLADTFSILADEQALVEALTLDAIELVTAGVSDNSPGLFRKNLSVFFFLSI